MTTNPNPSLTLPQLCCESSLEAGEPLIGTASRVDTWMLLEYNPMWGAKALPESKLVESVKGFVTGLLDTIPNSRFQFIRQRISERGGFAFYIAQSTPTNSRLYQFHLPTYEDLLALDVPSTMAGESGAELVNEPLYLVCTNGRRDPCCARFGVPLYEAMRSYGADSVWQTTHLGGHRFAGTMVCLPYGLYYGRVSQADSQTIVDATRAGQIVLDHFRGRCGYDASVQAAEYFVRQETGILEIDGLQLSSVEPLNEHNWIVRFTSPDQLHEAHIESRLCDFEVYESTGNPEKARVTVYDLSSYSAKVI